MNLLQILSNNLHYCKSFKIQHQNANFWNVVEFRSPRVFQQHLGWWYTQLKNTRIEHLEGFKHNFEVFGPLRISQISLKSQVFSIFAKMAHFELICGKITFFANILKNMNFMKKIIILKKRGIKFYTFYILVIFHRNAMKALFDP